MPSANIKVDVFPVVTFGGSQLGYFGAGLSAFLEMHLIYRPSNDAICSAPANLDREAFYNILYGAGFTVFRTREDENNCRLEQFL